MKSHRKAEAPRTFWCEAVARFPYAMDSSGEWMLGGGRAGTPRLAVRWLREWAVRIADALDPAPGCVPFPDSCLRESGELCVPGRVFRRWAKDFRAQEEQMAALGSGSRVGLAAWGWDGVHGRPGAVVVLYALSARPVESLPG